MNRLTLCAALVAALGMGATLAHADSFTYHGTLQDSGRPANGSFDIQLTLYSAQSGGTQLAPPVTLYAVPVKNGNFSTSVDFGQMSATNAQSWVDVKVKPAGSGNFTALDNRSPVAPDGGCPGSWTLDGNAGIPSGSYLGTSDSNTVYIEANAGTVAFFNPNGSTGISYPYGTSGAYSTAIGFNAGTDFDGSTVIGGYNDIFSNTIRDTNTNQTIIVAEHGVGINTAKASDGGAMRDELTIAPSPSLPGSNSDITLETNVGSASPYSGFNFAADPGGYFYLSGLAYDGTNLNYHLLMEFNFFSSGKAWINFNGTTEHGPLTVGDDGDGYGSGAYLTGGGVWTNASSRTFKDGFADVDVLGVLNKLVALPVQTWFYKESRSEGMHMGPFAEDFASVFGLGNDEKHITTVDESGVAFAAIQGLNKKVEAENASIKQENAELRSRLDAVVARLDKLESRKGE